MDDIAQWLAHHGLGKYTDTFTKNEVDMRALPRLTEDDLEQLGLPLGARRNLQAAIEQLTAADYPAAPRLTDDQPPDRASADTERRQLTVTFCDLVGSTALSERLDPEVYRDVLALYQSAAKRVIARYDGYIARYMGDGLLVYFGYPQAHEDDPERAVRSALDLVDAVARLTPPGDEVDLRVRIGIATGVVVAGDILGEGASQERAVSGVTPNLAARLQGIATPNAIVIAQSTQRLVEGRFELTELGAQQLAGISEPVLAFRVVAVRETMSRFEAMHGEQLRPLVGREGELALLRERWERARLGEGQAILLEGEPGIGKSRMIREFAEEVEQDAEVVLYQCSPYATGSAFYPFIEQLQRVAELTLDARAETRREKIQSLAGSLLPEMESAPALLAGLLSVPPDTLTSLDMTPQRRKAETIRLLVRLLEGWTAATPVLLIFEDAHWSDPTSQEVLDAVIERSATLPVLCIITYRPTFSPPWRRFGHVTTHSLNRLGRREVSHIIEDVADREALPAAIIEQIIAKTDGVPLFVEELTKTLLDADQPSRADGAAAGTIPSSLSDALLARLDQLDAAKEFAQVGACIGREFTWKLLAAVSAGSEVELGQALQRLVRSEIVYARGEPPDATYTFKHALVQDAAYDSLLLSRRKAMHGKIASALLSQQPELAASRPDLLAYHYSRAGLEQPAIRYYLAAGHSAIARSAFSEALTHLDASWEILNRQPAAPQRDRQAFVVLAARATALVATRGYLAPETLEAYESARALCDMAEEPSEVVTVLRGIFNAYNTQGRYREAGAVAQQCLAIARRAGDASSSLAHRLMGQNLFLRGDLLPASDHLGEALALAESERRARSGKRFGFDLQCGPLKYLPLTAWLRGNPDRSRAFLNQSVRAARASDSPFDLALALMWAYYLRMMLREYRPARGHAQELLVLAIEHEMPDFIDVAKMQRFLAEVNIDGNSGLSLNLALDHIHAYRSRMGKWVVPYNLATLSNALLLRGFPSEASTVIAEALQLTAETGERWSEAELLRLQGESLLAAGSDQPGAKDCLLQSLATSHRQGAIAWELRAASSLVRVSDGSSDRRRAEDRLAEVYQRFVEGAETSDSSDLVEARRLLGGIG